MSDLVLLWSSLFPVLVKLGPPRFRRFLVGLLPFEKIRRLRDVIYLMHNTSVEIFETKKRVLREGDEAVARQIGSGRDIISILSAHSYFLLDLITCINTFLSHK
jgi:hypothetical protein